MALNYNYDDSLHRDLLTKQVKSKSKLFSMIISKYGLGELQRKNRLPEQFIQVLRDTWDILGRNYPNRGDIQFELEPEFKVITNTYGSNHVKTFTVLEKIKITKFYAIIHFPEVMIYNSANNYHLIKDLFVRVPVLLDYDLGSVIFERIEGLRTTINTLELRTKYVHSHLPAESAYMRGEFKDFCTGSAEINDNTMLLNGSYSKELWELLLMSIDTFVRWESLEGTPFRYMRDIKGKNYEIPQVSNSSCVASYRIIEGRLRDKVFPTLKPIDIDWRVQNNRFMIVDNEKFEDFLISYYGIMTNRYYKDENGKYYSRANPDDIPSTGPFPAKVLFRGRLIPITVETVSRESTTTLKKYLHPKIKEYVKSKLEFKAYCTKIRQAALEQLSAVAHT